MVIHFGGTGEIFVEDSFWKTRLHSIINVLRCDGLILILKVILDPIGQSGTSAKKCSNSASIGSELRKVCLIFVQHLVDKCDRWLRPVVGWVPL